MTNETKAATGNTPSHIAYQVRDREIGSAIFTRIGAAWPNKDGKGFNIRLDAVPLSGDLPFLLRAPADNSYSS